MSTLFTDGLFHADDDAGAPLVGGKLYTYVAGTTTPTPTWADSALTVPNTNPVILNARGEASVWIGATPVRMQLRTPADVIVWDQDNITGGDNSVRVDLENPDDPARGAGMVGFKWPTLYPENTTGWGVRTSEDEVSILRYIPVGEWAAIANQTSTFDCATAFANLLTNHAEGYLPPGKYRTSAPVDLANVRRLRGSGERTSIIEATHTDPANPILYLGGESRIDELGLRFAPGIVTGSETQGQRVGVNTISPTTGFGTQRQGGMRNILIDTVGTGVFNGPGLNTAAFSCVFDSIEVHNWSHRGFDFLGSARTGNVFRNLYIHNIGTSFANADVGFAFGGDESETTIEQLNVEAGTMNAAVTFFNTHALACTGIHIEQVRLRNNDSGLVTWDRSTGRIESLTVYYCAIATTGWSVVKIFDSLYGGAFANPNTHNELRIGTLHCLGLNDSGTPPFDVGIGALVGFEFINRPLAAVGDFYMQVDRWVWNTFKGDQATFIAFPHDSQNRIKFASTIAGPPVGRVLTQTGWVRRPDGMIEQWGRDNVNANTTLTINLPIPFPNACRVQQANVFDPAAVNSYRVNANPVSNTQISLTNTSGGAATIHWWALGH